MNKTQAGVPWIKRKMPATGTEVSEQSHDGWLARVGFKGRDRRNPPPPPCWWWLIWGPDDDDPRMTGWEVTKRKAQRAAAGVIARSRAVAR